MDQRVRSPRGGFEPAYWTPIWKQTPHDGEQVLAPLGQAGPHWIQQELVVGDDGILLGGRKLGPGEARWLACRLLEAAAIYEMYQAPYNLDKPLPRSYNGSKRDPKGPPPSMEG